jgi:hypothetical protein
MAEYGGRLNVSCGRQPWRQPPTGGAGAIAAPVRTATSCAVAVAGIGSMGRDVRQLAAVAVRRIPSRGVRDWVRAPGRSETDGLAIIASVVRRRPERRARRCRGEVGSRGDEEDGTGSPAPSVPCGDIF